MNKTLEYMAVGVPVVAFDLTETRVSAGEAALYATPNEPAGLAERIGTLLDDPEQRERMGALGRQRIAGELSWSRSSEQLLAAYRLAEELRGTSAG
jgi:glycosyltransferase involved in cell wall biosynthesis